MKKILQVVLFVLLGYVSKSQTWCPTGAEWYFRYYHTGPMFYTVGTNTVRFQDTITENGILYKYCSAWFQGRRRIGVDIVTTGENLGTYKTYEAGNVLYVENYSGGFDTVFNYKAIPGDSWLAPLYKENCSRTREVITIVDTGHVSVNGALLQAFDFGFGLFPLKMYFPFPQACGTDEMGFGGFTCYKDENFPIYSFWLKSQGCNLVSIEEEHYENNRVHAYPNPNKGSFTINLEEASVVRIYNNLGSLIHEETLHDKGKHIINIPEPAAGIYYLKLENKSGNLNGKLIIQL